MPAPSVAVGAGFLEAIGARALAGRLFTAADFIEGAAPVAVVNEPFVQKFLGGRNPIGRRIRIEAAREREAAGTVARDRRRGSGSRPERRRSGSGRRLLHAGPRRAAVFPRDSHDGGSDDAGAPLRAAVANVDPDLQLEEIRTLEDAGPRGARVPVGIARR